MIYLGADHAGFEAKETLKAWLDERGYHYQDCGAHEFVADDDYPDIAQNVGHEVAKNADALGIVICGSGAGMAIAVNKIQGIRAAQAWNEDSAHAARFDDHANILALAGAFTSPTEIFRIVETFLTTQPSNEERHVRRIQKIE